MAQAIFFYLVSKTSVKAKYLYAVPTELFHRSGNISYKYAASTKLDFATLPL